ncbi:LysR family transcriptional regulator [Phaeobacter sp. NW0010-22]|uniref:LysR family transcriptional regulator n=1 Tax=Phaeobacter sp. NW0010-22 TaxID=3135907 RepID=UPI003106B343
MSLHVPHAIVHVMEWGDLKMVLAVVRAGTLAGASETLGVNYTTVARRISRIETALGERLFDRLPDGYHPTDACQIVADHAARMEVEQNALLRSLQGQDQSLTGPLVITAPQLLIGPHISPVLDRFTQMHPDVSLHLRASNELLDLSKRQADLAIRISRTPGDSLMGVRLCEQHIASFAAPEVADRIANDPQAPIDWIVYEQAPTVPKGVSDAYPNSRVRLVFDDMAAMIGAAQAGLGVLRTPMFLGRATVGLVQVPVLPPQSYADIWVVAHRDLWHAAKVKAFRQELVQGFKANRASFVA